jgi:hypothetical protein
MAAWKLIQMTPSLRKSFGKEQHHGESISYPASGQGIRQRIGTVKHEEQMEKREYSVPITVYSPIMSCGGDRPGSNVLWRDDAELEEGAKPRRKHIASNEQRAGHKIGV